MAGMSSSSEPAAVISSRTICAILFSVRSSRGGRCTPRGELLDVARAHHQGVGRRLRVLGRLAQRFANMSGLSHRVVCVNSAGSGAAGLSFRPPPFRQRNFSPQSEGNREMGLGAGQRLNHETHEFTRKMNEHQDAKMGRAEPEGGQRGYLDGGSVSNSGAIQLRALVAARRVPRSGLLRAFRNNGTAERLSESKLSIACRA